MCAKGTPYTQDVFFFPADAPIQMTDVRLLSWKEVFRELQTTRRVGGILTLPQVRDENGKELQYIPEQ